MRSRWRIGSFLIWLFVMVLSLTVIIGRQGRKPVTVQDVGRLESEYRESGGQKEALEALQAYAAVIRTIGDLRSAVGATEQMLARDPEFASIPRVGASAEKMRTEWAAVLNRVGIHSEGEWQAFLRTGIAFSGELLDGRAIDESTAAAACLARAQMCFQAGNHDQAMRDALSSLRYEPKAILPHFVIADVRSERQDYDGAIDELRKVSLRLSAWAHSAPPWEMRVALAMVRPRRAALAERRWRKRRLEVARAFGVQISSEISVLQSLQSIQQRNPYDPGRGPH